MSSVTPKFVATIKDKEIVFKRPDTFKQYVGKYEGKEVTIVVKRYFHGRSNSQNALYWVWLTAIGNDVGESPEDLHNTFKAMYLVDRSKKFPIVRSTSTLSTIEFMEYMEKIARKMSEFGIKLPSPDEAEL